MSTTHSSRSSMSEDGQSDHIVLPLQSPSSDGVKRARPIGESSASPSSRQTKKPRLETVEAMAHISVPTEVRSVSIAKPTPRPTQSKGSMSTNTVSIAAPTSAFQSDVEELMYGFGDTKFPPNRQSVELVEALAMDYIQTVCAKAKQVAQVSGGAVDKVRVCRLCHHHHHHRLHHHDVVLRRLCCLWFARIRGSSIEHVNC